MPVIDFSDNESKFLVRNGFQLHLFRDILTNKFVGIFDGTLLPRGIWVSKKDRDLKSLGNGQVVSEFRTVIGGDGFKSEAFIREKKPPNNRSEDGRIFPIREVSRKDEVCAALCKSKYGPFIARPNNRVHLPVPKTRSIGLFRTLMYADPARDVLATCLIQ